MTNFFYGIIALTKDMRLFIMDMLYNKSLVGFITGIIVATLITGLIITKNPKHIPLILRYSTSESFQKIAKRDRNGTYQLAFTNFVKMYTQTRTLFFVSFIALCVVVITTILTKEVI